MAKKCKCFICGKEFDREKEQAVIHGARRYSHYACEPDKPLAEPPIKAENPDLEKLNNYISIVYGDKANWALIKKQIKTFKDDYKYTYSGILKSLVYFYDIKKNSVDQSNGGIGIVPYVYKDAYNYYYSLFMAQQDNESKNFVTKIKEYIIKPPKPRTGTKIRLLDWSDDSEE